MRGLMLIPALLLTATAELRGNDVFDDYKDAIAEDVESIRERTADLPLPSLVPSPSPLVVFPKEFKTPSPKTFADFFNSESRPSTVRQRVENWAVEAGRTDLVERVLDEMDSRETRTRATLVAMRTALRDLDQLIDLPADPRKEKKRLEDIGYAFYPILNQALHWFRASPDGHSRLGEVVKAIDELDALLFFADLSPRDLKERLVAWSERHPRKADKSLWNPKNAGRTGKGPADPAYSLLLENILATAIMDSARDLAEFETVRIGRAL